MTRELYRKQDADATFEGSAEDRNRRLRVDAPRLMSEHASSGRPSCRNPPSVSPHARNGAKRSEHVFGGPAGAERSEHPRPHTRVHSRGQPDLRARERSLQRRDPLVRSFLLGRRGKGGRSRGDTWETRPLTGISPDRYILEP